MTTKSYQDIQSDGRDFFKNNLRSQLDEMENAGMDFIWTFSLFLAILFP